MIMGKIPLLLLPVGLYNLIVLGAGFASLFTHGVALDLGRPWLILPMTSPDAHWNISVGDLIIFIALICLFIEIINSTNTSNVTLTNHSLSMFVMIFAIVEFLLFGPFGTSTFFLLVAMTTLDVLAGFIVTTVSARKDIGFGA
jgi:hypothetical protein